MSPDPPPLSAGRVLADRFEIQRVLGRGGFGIAYLARDVARSDLAVVKELAPQGVRRDREGVLDLDRAATPGHILRHRFLQEAEVLRKLHHPGVPSLRATFSENGTAYYVTGFLPGAQTLEDRLRQAGPLSEDDAREVFFSLLDVLERVHAAGVLHRDIKPSNILLGREGEVLLIDFGAAREWVAENALTHTVMHTPGYAPPEQLSEKAARGPYTDLYGLSATIYHALAGRPPATANDRLAGVDLTPIAVLRREIDPVFANAIQACLEVRPADRPASVDEVRQMFHADQEPPPKPTDLESIDRELAAARRFRFERRACPACSGVLVEARPLRRGACPVCREGTVRRRELDERKCPICRAGSMETLENSGPLSICPVCAKGRLIQRRRSVLARDRIADCAGCGAHFEVVDGTMRLGEESATFEEWRARCGRGAKVRACSTCDAQFDLLVDGRWQRFGAGPAYYAEEWTRLAAGLSPGAGNASCDLCHADYWLEDDRLTLLDAATDPFDFGSRYTGRALQLDDVRWLGVGKSSGSPGLYCEECPTEFDRDGEYYRLVRSQRRELSRHLGEPRTLEDWHRIGQKVPTIDRQGELEKLLVPMLREAYRNGDLSFDNVDTAWRGQATRLSDETVGTLIVSAEEVSFGGRFRRWKVPVDAVLRASFEEDELEITLSGRTESVVFDLQPIVLTAHLESGNWDLVVTAEDLAKRLC
ncbi:serine/threonine protein kinase [Fimbriimonas ginsengisoli]|uniref:Serine/threonine protein kinase n=1 Tax=Fimbriimonas ginsengisoli Gsoil 348 TaxID=661478 RepID=A0A068NVM3_FIMGI|nr:serine/threonine-protein kinase [Fimbriimonas ginsengisoli]AIE87427.1 serine/threonine protein kinase [Fimbriimonas ginsengisoli Gsoil 348]